ncbi:CapA family protein [Chloroflexota bacterium]
MADEDDMVTLVAVGDIFPTGQYPDEVFNPTRPILKGADLSFGQLEAILSRRGSRQLFATGGGANKMPVGGTGMPRLYELYDRADPDVGAQALSNAGFNIMSFASNHTMDLSEEAMFDTINVLKNKSITVIGAGKNIEEARRPAIFELKGARVGFLAYCSVGIPGSQATEDISGVAPVRATTSYEQFDWQPGAPPKILTRTNPEDLTGMVEDIKKLRPQVDALVVSMHWGVHFVPALIADYQFEAGHAAIDAGADLIIGHHPHILKGIEVYKGKVIFFSLCNFSFTSLKFLPTRAAGRYWFSAREYRFEVDPSHPNYKYPIDSQKTILVKCNISKKGIERVTYLPLWVNTKGQPEPVSRSDLRSDEHYRYMEWMCGSQGLDTKFSREVDEVVVLTK